MHTFAKYQYNSQHAYFALELFFCIYIFAPKLSAHFITILQKKRLHSICNLKKGNIYGYMEIVTILFCAV